MHFIFVLKYAYPLKDDDKERFDFYSTTYCYPYFHQDWRLFTPCPNYNFYLYASYNVNGEQRFSQPLQEALEQGNIFNGSEFLKLALSAAQGYVGHEENKKSSGVIKFPQGKNYLVLQTLVRNYLQHKHGAEIKDMKMVMIMKGIKNGTIKCLIDQ